MQRVMHKTRTFRQADEWDIRQQLGMSAQQRIRIVRELQKRVYSDTAKDVRACHKKP